MYACFDRKTDAHTDANKDTRIETDTDADIVRGVYGVWPGCL